MLTLDCVFQTVEIARGLEKGRKVTKRDIKARPSTRKGHASKRSTFVRGVIRDVAGFAPYERRVMVCIKKLSRDPKILLCAYLAIL